MNKAELINAVSERTEITKTLAKDVIETLVDVISQTLENGEKVSLIELGTFKPVTRKAKTARNPKTGATVNVPEKKTAVFKASKALKEKLN